MKMVGRGGKWTVMVMMVVVAAVMVMCCCKTTEAKKKESEWCLPLKKAEGKKGLKLTCKGQGQIVSLAMRGVNDSCEALTADLFVQMNSCLWKKECQIKKDKKDVYNVKLYKNSPISCITTVPKYYKIKYLCSKPGVKVLDVLPDEAQGNKKLSQGIVRSHVDHPWLYRPTFSPNTLTLLRPQGARSFLYTIQSLKLMHRDELTIMVDSSKHRNYTRDVTNVSDVINRAERVTLQLVTSSSSGGEEGFVICFKWADKEVVEAMDVCSEMITLGPKAKHLKPLRKCNKKKGNKGKNKKGGNKDKKKGSKKRKNRQKKN